MKNGKKSKHAASFTEPIKQVALYIFVLMGPIAYETLQRNLVGSLPSLSTVRNRKELMKEIFASPKSRKES